MLSANIHEAKTHFSKWVTLASQGEDVLICKHGQPVAKLVSYHEKKEPRRLGQWKGKVVIADDFDDLPKEFVEHFK